MLGFAIKTDYIEFTNGLNPLFNALNPQAPHDYKIEFVCTMYVCLFFHPTPFNQ